MWNTINGTLTLAGIPPEAFDYGHYEFNAKTALSEAMRGWAAGKYSLLDVFTPHPNVYGMAAVGRGNVLGVQFHPEKSGNVGLAILRAFCEREVGA